MTAELTQIAGQTFYVVDFMGDEVVFDSKEEAEQFIAEVEG